jgi:aldose 1-epimerase
MFEIRKEPFGTYVKLILYNMDSDEYLSIIPLIGANTNKLVLQKGGALHQVFAEETNPEKIRANAWHNGARLIPYPNRIRNGSYTFNNRTYHLPINFSKQNHSIHGLLYNKQFCIISSHTDKKAAQVTLENHYRHEEPGYPFYFTTSITYDRIKKKYKKNN